MAYYLRLLALVASIALVAAEDNVTNHIFQPAGITDAGTSDQNRIYVVGKQYPISWMTSTQQPYVVALWQNIPGAGYAINISTIACECANGCNSYTADILEAMQQSGHSSVNWTCDLKGADFSLSNIFYVELRSNDVSIASHYLNISKSDVPTAQNYALASSIATMTATTLSTSTTSSTTGTSSAAAATNAPSTAGESTATKVGLGVGLGIGIPLLLILAVWAGFSILRKRKPMYAQRSATPSWFDAGPVYGNGVYVPVEEGRGYGHAMPHVYEKPADHVVMEVPADREPVELPGAMKG